jgi:hypothetical protein
LVPPPGAAAPFECRLHHPSAWTPSEQQSAQVLPLPPALQALLGMMLHLNTCYGFLLAQHIQPSWPRLVSLMSRLFPQVGEWGGGGGRGRRGRRGDGGSDLEYSGLLNACMGVLLVQHTPSSWMRLASLVKRLLLQVALGVWRCVEWGRCGGASEQ